MDKKSTIMFSFTMQILLTVVFVFSISLLYAAPPPPDEGGCWPPSTCIPIDGGISLLIASGVLFGVKKAWDLKKKLN